MAYLLRHPAVFAVAKQVLTPEHFTEAYEIIWAVTWRSALDLFDQFEQQAPYHVLEADTLSRIESHPGEIPETGVAELRRFLKYVFDDIKADTINRTNYGLELLQNFLKERHWLDPIKQQFAEYGNDVPVAARAVFRHFEERLEAVESVRRTSTTETPDELEDVEDEGEQYRIDNLIPVEGVTYIAGPEKSRKTTGVGVELAAGIGTGTAVFGGRFQVARPCKVLYISAETRRRTMRSVLRRLCRERGVTLRQSGVHLDCKPPASAHPRIREAAGQPVRRRGHLRRFRVQTVRPERYGPEGRRELCSKDRPDRTGV